MSSTKAKLKASRDAIQAKKWEEALERANEVLEDEVSNYNALVFRAVALQNLERYEDAEQSLHTATQAQKTQPLAWQGLEKLYREREEWSKLARVAREQMDVHLQSGDADKCAEALQKLVDVQRSHGTRGELADALSLHLASSPFYELLLALPEPDQTQPMAVPAFETAMNMHVRSLDVLREVIDAREAGEREAIDQEVAKRKGRLENLGVPRDVLAQRVGVEFWSRSELPGLYEQALAHPRASDELRRDVEHRLLRYSHRLLLALPPDAETTKVPSTAAATSVKAEGMPTTKTKSQLRDEVLHMCKGMVLIEVPDELAWSVVLEWPDHYHLAECSRDLMRNFTRVFPNHALAESFDALLRTLGDELYLAEKAERREKLDIDEKEQDPLVLAISCMERVPSSVLAHRIAATLYALDADYASTIEVCEAAMSLSSNLERETGVSHLLTRLGIGVTLGCALARHHTPQHHTRALRMLLGALEEHPDDWDALFAKGLIAEAAQRWQQARADFGEVTRLVHSQQGSEDVEARARFAAVQALSALRSPDLEATLEVAWCDVEAGVLEQGRAELEDVIEQLDSDAGEYVAMQDKAKAWWRLGQCLWMMGGESRESEKGAFACFITALKRDSAYAPAFTSLGLYYESVATPPDPMRAAKCFQKAFELDASQHVAAHKLAAGFAEEREWELVDVVARRTIEGEGGAEALSASTGGASLASLRRHASRNPWAWKAIGATELQRGVYEAAISALQVCLRASPDDDSAWQRLGEAYAASGRHTAALKAFGRAHELQPESWVSLYSIADVFRQMGEYEEALRILDALVQEHSGEAGLRLSLAETLLLLGNQQALLGCTSRARVSLLRSLKEANVVLDPNASLSAAWKIAADSVFHLSRLGNTEDRSEAVVVKTVETILQVAHELKPDAGLPSVGAVTKLVVEETRQSSPDPTFLLAACTYLYKLRVVLSASDPKQAPAAWSDLAMSLYLLGQKDDFGTSRDQTEEGQAQAVGCLKEALRLQPRSARLWMLLGNIVFLSNARLAQHCYVQAIEASPREATPWSNYGFLCLHQGDTELANEAFIKAQTLDPDFAHAWVGQAIVAEKHGDADASRALSQHAVGLCEGGLLEADYGFAASVFALYASSRALPPTHLYSPSFALSAYLSRSPYDDTSLHLSALIAERLGQEDKATQQVEMAARLLEARYEATEKQADALHYAVCQANLGRILLSSGEAEKASEALQSCLALLEGVEDDSDTEEADDADGPKLTRSLGDVRMNANISLALARHSLGDEAGSIDAFRDALECVPGDDEASKRARCSGMVELARVLWATGDAQMQEEAKTQLLEGISLSPHHADAICTLAAVGLVEPDESLLDAALAEIESLPTRHEDDDTQNGVTQVLAETHLAQGQAEQAVKALEDAARSQPWCVDAALRVAKISRLLAASASGTDREARQVRAHANAQEALQHAEASVEFCGAGQHAEALRLVAVAHAEGARAGAHQAGQGLGDAAGTGAAEVRGASGTSASPPSTIFQARSAAQRAVHLAPWEAQNWVALQLVSQV